MRVLLEDKNQTVEVPDGLGPQEIEAELRKFYTHEELFGSTTFEEREGYRIRKGRALVDEGKLWHGVMTGQVPHERAIEESSRLTAEFSAENDERYQAHNWPERFAGATTELAPYMLDSAIEGVKYGEYFGATAAGAALLGGQAGPQALIPEEIITVPGAYIAGRSIGQAWGTWMNAAKVEGGQLYKSLIENGVKPGTAQKFAVPAGYLIGAIELLQVERLLPSFGREGISNYLRKSITKPGSKAARTLGKVSGRLAKNLAETTALETSQEIAQEIVGISAEVGAALYNDMAEEEGYLGPSGKDVQERLTETLTSSLLAFPLLGLPRAVHSTVSLHGRDKFVDRMMTEKAKESLSMELTEQIEQASSFDNFKDFHESLASISEEQANALGFDNVPLLEEALWNASRDARDGQMYAENLKMRREGKSDIGGAFKEAYQSASESISRIAEPISTRLKQINPKLKNRLRRYEFDLKQRVLQDEISAKIFLDAYQNLSEQDQSDLDLALKNGDTEKINEIVSRNNMSEKYELIAKTLGALHKRATDTGLDIGFIENYFPRKVKDVKGMLDFFGKKDTWPQMQRAIQSKEESLGRKMTDDEKAELLNSILKGVPGSSMPGNLKQRQISKISPDLNPFYLDSPQALLSYIYRVNDFIEARRFFGKSVKGSEMSEKALEDSIGSFVLDLLESGDIKGEQAKQVSDILRARFSSKGPGKYTSAIKNITYIESMGSITSAITQIGDFAFSLYENGFYRTGKALAGAASGRSQITKEDIGIERIAEEFADRTRTAKALDAVFKMTGLDFMDRLGKQTQINAAFEKFSAKAKSPDAGFLMEMDHLFGDEAGQVVEDLKAKNASDNVRFLLFSELADVQPIALSEMPEQYLKSGNGRIFYMLKTYSIKQIDVFRNEVFLLMKDDPAKALGNLIRLSAMLILANVSADVLKDLLLGRPIEAKDYLIDNLLRLFGLTRYNVMKFRKEGVVQGLDSLLPPVGTFLNRAGKDLDAILKDDGEFEPQEAEIIQSIPLLGKLYYWWMGGGRAKIEAEE